MVSGEVVEKIYKTMEACGIDVRVLIANDQLQVACFREEPITTREKDLVKEYLALITGVNLKHKILLFFDPSPVKQKHPLHLYKRGRWMQTWGRPNRVLMESNE